MSISSSKLPFNGAFGLVGFFQSFALGLRTSRSDPETRALSRGAGSDVDVLNLTQTSDIAH